MGQCIIPNCSEDAHYTYLQLCKACYSGFFYWRDRSPDEIEERIVQLYRLTSRLEEMVGRDAHPIHPRKFKGEVSNVQSYI